MHARFVSLGVVGTLAVGAVAFAGASESVPAVAAEYPVTVCNQFNGGIRQLIVTQTGPRTFDVVYIDANTLSAEDTYTPGANAYVPLPLTDDPATNMRTGTNTLVLGDAVTVSDLQISQSIQTDDPGNSDPWALVALVGNAPAAWESVAQSGENIVWTFDIDAATLNGAQVRPDQFMFPGQLYDTSASVLEFTATLPDDAVGEMDLVSSLNGSFMTGARGGPANGPWVWAPDGIETYEAAGCTVTLEAIPVPSTDTPTPSTGDPTPSTTAAAPGQTLAPTGAEAHGAFWTMLAALMLMGAGVTAALLRRRRADR